MIFWSKSFNVFLIVIVYIYIYISYFFFRKDTVKPKLSYHWTITNVYKWVYHRYLIIQLTNVNVLLTVPVYDPRVHMQTRYLQNDCICFRFNPTRQITLEKCRWGPMPAFPDTMFGLKKISKPKDNSNCLTKNSYRYKYFIAILVSKMKANEL